LSIKKYLALLDERIITVEKNYNVRKPFSNYIFFSTVIIRSRSAKFFVQNAQILTAWHNFFGLIICTNSHEKLGLEHMCT